MKHVVTNAMDGATIADESDPDFAANVDAMLIDNRLYVPAHGFQLGLVPGPTGNDTIAIQLWIDSCGIQAPFSPHGARMLAQHLLNAADVVEADAKRAASAAIDKARRT